MRKMYVNILNKKVAVCTLGCKVNQYESDSMIDILKKNGCEIVPFSQYADIYIVNTCSVTNMAERKSRQMLHRAKKKNPEAVIVAAGCYVQAAETELAKDLGIDILIGNNCKKDVARILSEYYEDTSLCEAVIDINHTNEYEEMTLVKPNERCRAYVKVQDGCNNFCTYCIIPYTRGRIRSRKLADVVQEVEGLACEGVQEVVITGINLSSYEDENGASLLMLLQAVAKVDGIRRIRMGSLEPRVITEEFLDGITALDKVCPHFHLSLQSACNETLKRMNRKYMIEEYMGKCDMIRKAYDRPAIATDVIVGFPGETEEEFATTVANLEKLNLYEMHVFKYSKRSGTIAATMEHQVSDAVKEKRSNILLELTANQKAAYEQQFSGELLPVLMEEYDCIDKDGKPVYVMKGHTDRYILVKQETTREVCEQSINAFVDVLYRPEKSK